MKLDNKHIDRLRIVLDMGTDEASRDLSKALRTAATIYISETALYDAYDITEKLNNDEREMVASLLVLHGTGNGKVLFMVDKKDAFILKDLYLREKVGTTKEYDEYVESTIQEIGNILSGSISNSLSTDFGLTILPSPPLVTCDFAGTIFESMIMEELLEDDDLILMDTSFNILHYNFNCYFYLIPGKKIIEKLF